MTFKLGLNPATSDPRDLCLARYIQLEKLPDPPKAFGHYQLITQWKMLANDRWGCCAWSGPAHEVMVLNKAAGRAVAFTDQDVLADYAACTGFNPDDPATDRGTDLRVAASYRRTRGIGDSTGHRHQIGAYVWLKPGDLDEARLAAYLFGTVGVGVRLPDTAMRQFAQGEPWDVVRGAQIEGGHYIPLVGVKPDGNLVVVTWGQAIEMTPAFYREYSDQALAYLSADELNDSGLTPEGFGNEQLARDLAAL